MLDLDQNILNQIVAGNPYTPAFQQVQNNSFLQEEKHLPEAARRTPKTAEIGAYSAASNTASTQEQTSQEHAP